MYKYTLLLLRLIIPQCDIDLKRDCSSPQRYHSVLFSFGRASTANMFSLQGSSSILFIVVYKTDTSNTGGP